MCWRRCAATRAERRAAHNRPATEKRAYEAGRVSGRGGSGRLVARGYDPDAHLHELCLALPSPAALGANHANTVRVGNILYLAGTANPATMT